MTKQDRQKAAFLVILLAVLAATITLGYRMNRPPTTTTAADQPAEQKTSANPPAASDARIRLDLVESAADEEAGKKNLFQYRQPPAPPITARPPQSSNVFPPPMVNQPPVVQRPAGPPTPPPPPPINLKYQGIFTVKGPEAGFVAVLADDSRHYNVKTGEILMGRYRIASISDKQVEVEDLEYNRRQTLPLLK